MSFLELQSGSTLILVQYPSALRRWSWYVVVLYELVHQRIVFARRFLQAIEEAFAQRSLEPGRRLAPYVQIGIALAPGEPHGSSPGPVQFVLRILRRIEHLIHLVNYIRDHERGRSVFCQAKELAARSLVAAQNVEQVLATSKKGLVEKRLPRNQGAGSKSGPKLPVGEITVFSGVVITTEKRQGNSQGRFTVIPLRPEYRDGPRSPCRRLRQNLSVLPILGPASRNGELGLLVVLVFQE